MEIKAQWVKGGAHRTPDEVLEQIEQFIKENDRFPSESSADEAERFLRKAFDHACKKAETLTDATSQRLLALKEQWVRERRAKRTPDAVLVQVEQFIRENDRFPSEYSADEAERSLRVAFNGACKKAKSQNLTDTTSLRLLALKKQGVGPASRAAKLAGEQLASPDVITEEYIEQLMNFYNRLDPFESGFLE